MDRLTSLRPLAPNWARPPAPNCSPRWTPSRAAGASASPPRARQIPVLYVVTLVAVVHDLRAGFFDCCGVD